MMVTSVTTHILLHSISSTATFWIEEELYLRKEDTDLVVTVHRDGNLEGADEVGKVPS